MMLRMNSARLAIVLLTMFGTHTATANTPFPLIKNGAWSATVERPANGPAFLRILGRPTLKAGRYKAVLKLRRHLLTNPAIPVYELVLRRRADADNQKAAAVEIRHNVAVIGTAPRVVHIVFRGKRIARIKVANT